MLRLYFSVTIGLGHLDLWSLILSLTEIGYQLLLIPQSRLGWPTAKIWWSKLWERCQKPMFKALKNTFKYYFFFESQLTRLIQNKTKYCNIKAFYKTHSVYSYNQWNYFLRGCMEKWRSGDFSIQTWCIPLEALASKNVLNRHKPINERTNERTNKNKRTNNKNKQTNLPLYLLVIYAYICWHLLFIY